MSNPWIKQNLERQFGDRGWTVTDYAGNDFALIKDISSDTGNTFMIEVHEYGASYWRHKEDSHFICVHEFQRMRERYEETGEMSAESNFIFYRPDGEKHAYLTEDAIVFTLADEKLMEIEAVINEFNH